MKRRQYRNPPIEEAVCAIYFLPPKEQDFFAPARFYEKVRKTYAGKPTARIGPPSQLQVQQGPQGFQLAVGQEPGKIFFPDEEGTRLVALGMNSLSIHVLRPYPGWDDFRKRIASALQAFEKVSAPKGIRKIELRYINKIELVQEGVGPNEYVTAGVVLPKELPLKVSGFFGRAESVYEDRPMQLSVTVASVESSNPKAEAFLLDLEVKQEWSEKPLSMADAIDEIDELRLRERIAFESCITERAREVFDAK